MASRGHATKDGEMIKSLSELMEQCKLYAGIQTEVDEEVNKMVKLNIEVEDEMSSAEIFELVQEEIRKVGDKEIEPFSLELIEHLNDQRVRLLKERGERYSTYGHITQNFEDVSSIANTLRIHVTPYDVAMILAILKMVRDANGRYRGCLLYTSPSPRDS